MHGEAKRGEGELQMGRPSAWEKEKLFEIYCSSGFRGGKGGANAPPFGGE